VKEHTNKNILQNFWSNCSHT